MKTKNLDRLISTTTIILIALLYGCGKPGGITSSGGSGPRVTQSDQFSHTLDAAGAVRLTARTTNGSITLRAGEGEDVRVTVTREVKANDPTFARNFIEDVIVTAERRGDDVVLDTTYPKPPNNVNVIVNFDITAPPGLAVELGTVNGLVTVEGMKESIVAGGVNSVIDIQGARGPLTASTVNGLITADLTDLLGEGTFSTVNGAITVTARKGEMPISATTLNGSVTVSLPGDFDGSLDARTFNGSASSDFSVTLTETRRNNRLVGGIGDGGNPTIKLRSTNGNVRLRKVGGS